MAKRNPHCANPECKHFRSIHGRVSEGGCRAKGCECTRYHGSLEHQPKMSTVAYRKLLAPAGGAAGFRSVLAAAGVDAPDSEVQTAQRANEWLLHGSGESFEIVPPSVLVEDVKSAGYNRTLATIMPQIKRGSWLLFTEYHVIAVRDGEVTDPFGADYTTKRVVKAVYRMKNGGPKPAAKCGCYDPLVFGHWDGHRDPDVVRGERQALDVVHVVAA
jgi:hypothetical protein